MKAREVMNGLVVRVDPSESIQLVAELMSSERTGVVCVCDGDRRPLGVITDRDIVVRVCAAHRSPETTAAALVMSRDPLTCSLDDDLDAVQDAMRQRRFARCLVLDAQGRLVGLISMAELWHYESPHKAAMVSRAITEREFRQQSSGSIYPVGGPSHYLFGAEKEREY